MTNIVIDSKDLVKEVEKRFNDKELKKYLFRAYNRYQEDERDGVDYIFDLSNKDDLVHLVKCGLSANEIYEAYSKSHNTTYTFYGINHQGINFMDYKEFNIQLFSYIEEIVEQIIKYPFDDCYKWLYTELVTNKLLD